jgi:simple sugar transport system substrate-binding protein
MPETVAEGIVKIAVVVNLAAGDQARLFIEGCVSEGRSMGFTVDTFITGGNEQRCGELVDRISQADYDGLVFSNGSEVFSYDILRPVAERGVKIVTFEALPVKEGRTVNGITATFLDDYGLARLSLDELISCTGDIDRPPRVIRIGTNAGIPFMARRARVFDDYLNEGRIEEAALVNVSDPERHGAAVREILAEVLSHFPPGTVDALWSPLDECSAGCIEALEDTGRQDIKMVSIGISNDDLHLMQRHPEIWLASAAVDPKLAGTVNMRIMAAKLAGEMPPDTFAFTPKLVRTEDLSRVVNIANISVMIPEWGEGRGLFDYYRWMIDLKAAEVKYLRIRPSVDAAPEAAK